MKKTVISLSLLLLICSHSIAQEAEESSYWEQLKEKVSLEKIESKFKEGVDIVKEKISTIDEKKVDDTLYDTSKMIDIDKREEQVVSTIEEYLPDWEIVRSGTMTIRAGSDLVRATMITDKEIKVMADYSIAELDKKNTLLDSNSSYSMRLQKLKKSILMPRNLKIDIKAYKSSSINLFALANGSIRVYSGLMDIMDDNELLFMIGHELGHIEHKHRKDSYRLSYLVSGLRKGTIAQGGLTGTIAEGVVGKLSSDLINEEFSKTEEKEADQYALMVLQKKGLSKEIAISSFDKLKKTSSPLLSSHPLTIDRVNKL